MKRKPQCNHIIDDEDNAGKHRWCTRKVSHFGPHKYNEKREETS